LNIKLYSWVNILPSRLLEPWRRLVEKNSLTTWCNYNIAWSNNSLIAWSSPRLCSSTTWILLPGLKFEALNAFHWHIRKFNLRTCLGPILKFIACHFYSWELMNILNVCISLQHQKLMRFFIVLAILQKMLGLDFIFFNNSMKELSISFFWIFSKIKTC
jgi:hypothetical protein